MQASTVPALNVPLTASRIQPVPLWSQPTLTQPPVSTQPTISQATTNTLFGQVGGSNPPNNSPNNPPNNPPTGGLDPNMIALINAIGGLNWRAGGGGLLQKRELSLIRPTEFSGREIEDPNDWLEKYNRIADTNK